MLNDVTMNWRNHRWLCVFIDRMLWEKMASAIISYFLCCEYCLLSCVKCSHTKINQPTNAGVRNSAVVCCPFHCHFKVQKYKPHSTASRFTDLMTEISFLCHSWLEWCCGFGQHFISPPPHFTGIFFHFLPLLFPSILILFYIWSITSFKSSFLLLTANLRLVTLYLFFPSLPFSPLPERDFYQFQLFFLVRFLCY